MNRRGLPQGTRVRSIVAGPAPAPTGHPGRPVLATASARIREGCPQCREGCPQCNEIRSPSLILDGQHGIVYGYVQSRILRPIRRATRISPEALLLPNTAHRKARISTSFAVVMSCSSKISYEVDPYFRIQT